MHHFDGLPRPGYDPVVATYLSALEDGTREWLGELGEQSEDVLVWQPFPNGHSVGALILHNADVEAYWIHQVICGVERTEEFSKQVLSAETDQDGVNWPTPPRMLFHEYMTIYFDVRAKTMELLKSVTDLDREIQLSWGVVTPRWILGHVVQHDSYHGGQAVFISLLAERTR